MHSWIDDTTIRRIDNATMRHARPHSNLGELEQLAQLFSPAYVRALYRALAPKSRAEACTRALTIKLGWIDKIPLAETKLFKQRVELGDLALFAIDQWADSMGKPVAPARARGVVAQAKVARSIKRTVAPTVPIASVRSSTARELTLLSQWPCFDLYKTSASLAPLAPGIDLRGNTHGPFPFGWYLAAPCDPKNRLVARPPAWPSWWMAGPPILGDAVDTSFGSFLAAFMRRDRIATSAGALSVGDDFTYSPPTTTPTGTGWSRVCAELLKLLEEGSAPQHLFAGGVNRLAALRPVLLGFMDGGRGPMTLHPEWTWPDSLTGTTAVFDNDGEGWRRQAPCDAGTEPADGMPVLVIHNTYFEA